VLSPSFLAIGSICPLVLFLVAPNFKVVARTSYIDRINCLSNRLASRLSADQQFQCLVDGSTFIVLAAFQGFPSALPLNRELRRIFGDGVNQAADLVSGATSIPSRNLTPLMTFGN
jgi:hypothetical protein